MKSLLIALVISVLCSCGTEDRKRAEVDMVASDLTEVFDKVFDQAKPPFEKRKIDMNLGQHTLNGGTEASSDHVRVVRTDTLVILTDASHRKALTDMFQGFPKELQAKGFEVRFESATTDEMPEPQYFEAELSKGDLSGFVLLTMSAPLNGYLTMTTVAHLDRRNR